MYHSSKLKDKQKEDGAKSEEVCLYFRILITSCFSFQGNGLFIFGYNEGVIKVT